MTRLISAEVEGFRAFGRTFTFDLDAAAIILSGPNGSGKTSLFDSILWALSGTLPRFAGRQAQAISLYSQSGSARVALTLEDVHGQQMTVIRTASSEEHSDALVKVGSEQFEGNAAELKILETFWPSALLTRDSAAAFCMAFTRSVYLQQDLVREFIESDSEEERFTVMSELLGAGRLNEFMRELERDRNAWSRVRTEREREAAEAEARVAQLRSRLERLRASADEDLEKRWIEWWSAARSAGAADSEPGFGSADAARLLNDVLATLQAQRRQLERRGAEARQLLNEWSARVPRAEALDLADAKRRQQELSAELDATRTQLSEAQQAAAREREQLTRQRESQEELSALAALALRHLGEHCPVCQQTYDVDQTRQRLEQLAAEAPGEERPQMAGRVDELAAQVANLERSLSALTSEIAEAERAAAEARAWRDRLLQNLADLGMSNEATPADLERQIADLAGQTNGIADLYGRGEELALSVAGAAEAAQRAELEEQLAAAEPLAEERNAALAAHEQARETATTILEATRAAARELVDARVTRIQPLVERIYARMDPHPSFTNVSLATSYHGGRGRLQPLVADPTAGLAGKDPYPLFSSSQLNALAVSLFLGLNLGTPGAPLHVVMLDDPLQSLDDVNLLGLVDTLRRTKAVRQLVVSTHDQRFANLLERKLRPVGDDGPTRVFSFSSWDERGPQVEAEDVLAEEELFRVAAA